MLDCFRYQHPGRPGDDQVRLFVALVAASVADENKSANTSNKQGEPTMQVALAETLVDVIEAMLPKFSGKLALQFMLHLNVNYYGDADDRREDLYVQYLIHRPNNYTKVFIRTSESPNGIVGPWHKASDHDSGWRYDGFSDLERLMTQLEGKVGLVEQKKLHERVTFNVFDGAPHYVTLENSEALDVTRADGTKNHFPRTFNLTIGPKVPLGKIHEYLSKKD